MELTRDRAARTISLSQSFYINSVLKRFDMLGASPMPTPIDVDHGLVPAVNGLDPEHAPKKAKKVKSPADKTKSPPPPRPFPELVGSLMYAMMCTRPDLAYAVSVLSRFVGPGRHAESHWRAALRVLRYLGGNSDYALTLGGLSASSLQGFSDSSWADVLPDRRSTQGYAFSFGSGLISWRCTRSSSIALSSAEAELYAATLAAQEARWLSYLLAEMGHPVASATLWCDNASTIHMCKAAAFHGRSKHIELRHFFIRDQVAAGFLLLRKIPSDLNLADIFTKPLPRLAHRGFTPYLGLSRCRSSGGVPTR